MEHTLGRIWSPVRHLQSVLGSPEWREAYNQALPLLTEHGTEISQNERLQRAYAAVGSKLPPDEPARRAAAPSIMRCVTSTWPASTSRARPRIASRPSCRSLRRRRPAFEHNVQDASDAWSLHLTEPTRSRACRSRRSLGQPKMPRKKRSTAGCCHWTTRPMTRS